MHKLDSATSNARAHVLTCSELELGLLLLLNVATSLGKLWQL